MVALYLCYQSVTEPLTQTQVIAYLEGLARAGYPPVLLTFEPRPLADDEVRTLTDGLAARGIIWRWLHYHKRPTVPATAWDTVAGIAYGTELIRRYRIRLVHARAHVPGLMALALKRLTGVRLLFDIRGFMAEEYVDKGVWPAGGALFRATKRVERALVRAADGVVVLTHQGRRLLDQWYPGALDHKPVEVIPCCADLRHFPPAEAVHAADQPRSGLVYTGKLGGWYLTDAMAAFVEVAREFLPEVPWHIWTQSDAGSLQPLLRTHHLEQGVTIGCVTPQELPHELNRASAALAFIKSCVSAVGCSPTKVGEYLAAGLPVVATAGIGDLQELLAGQPGQGPVGVLVRDTTREAFVEAVHELQRLLADPETRRRCRDAARDHFDLEQVGWTRYRRMYQRLLGTSNNHYRAPQRRFARESVAFRSS
jgi:glycosyltransferase involved in cell wall biosynthesis